MKVIDSSCELNSFLVLGDQDDGNLGPEDTDIFRNMIFVVLGVGGVSSIAFCFLVSEKDKYTSKVIVPPNNNGYIYIHEFAITNKSSCSIILYIKA